MQSAVEQIKDRLPITDVLSSYISITPSGSQFKAKCPFHNERTASFSISPDRGLYYCFGCGAKGDIFTFVQQFEGTDFNGALKILAERAGVELRSSDRRRDNLDPIYEILEKTTQRYQNELKENKEAQGYLKKRGITESTIKDFRVGYAPDEWRFVANTLKNEQEKVIALRAGLIKKPQPSEKGETSPYDRFRKRIIFPITDSTGRVVGFSGRIFPESEDGPKYLNSPETEVFQKSKVLYGFDKAKNHIRKFNFSILVEGQMDLITSHQAGFRNTVATSGTAVSEQVLQDTHSNLAMLSRLTPHIFLAFDGDMAGKKALSRAALVALSLNMNPKVVLVPENIDPAEYIIANGPEMWKKLLTQSVHFIQYKSEELKKRKLSPHMLARGLKEEIFPYLSRVGSPLEKNLLTESVAKELGIGLDLIKKELDIFEKNKTEVIQKIEKNEDFVPDSKMRLFAFLERYPSEFSEKIKSEMKKLSFDDEDYEQVIVDSEIKPKVLALIERDYGHLAQEELKVVALELQEKAKNQFFMEINTKLTQKLNQAEKEGNQEDSEKLLKKLSELNKLRHG